MRAAAKTKTENQPNPLCAFGANGFVFSLAAKNSRLGFAASGTERYWAPLPANPQNALGLLPEVRQNHVGLTRYGDEITSTANDREKFGHLYTRFLYRIGYLAESGLCKFVWQIQFR